MAAVNTMQTLSPTPVMTMPEGKRHTQICSSSEASNSPAEPHNIHNGSPYHTQQQILDHTGSKGWGVSTQREQRQSGDNQFDNTLQSILVQTGCNEWALETPETPFQFGGGVQFNEVHAAGNQRTQLSDGHMYPHTLDSIFNTPALSLDSNHHPQAEDGQPGTPQSQHVSSPLEHYHVDYACQGEQQQQRAHEQQQYKNIKQYENGQQQHETGHQQYENGQQPAAACLCPVAWHDLQPYCSLPLASSHHTGNLQWADSCPVPMAMPKVVRKTSSDTTIE